MNTNNSRRTKAHQMDTSRREKERATASMQARIIGIIYVGNAVGLGYLDGAITGWLLLNLILTFIVVMIGKATSRGWVKAFYCGLAFSWIIGLIVLFLGKKEVPPAAFVPDDESLLDPVEAWEKEQAVKAGPPPAPAGWKDRLAE